MLSTVSKDLPIVQTSNTQSKSIPPEESLWEKYSASGESVVSGVASFTIHAIAIVIILTGVILVFRKPDPPPMVPLEPLFTDGSLGGGSGHPDASSNSPGIPSASTDHTLPLNPKTPPSSFKDLPDKDEMPQIGPTKTEDDPFAEIDPVKAPSKAKQPSLGELLRDAISKRTGTGMTGKGRDGGTVTGKSGGAGKDDGPGTGSNARQKRLDRWEIVFTANDAKHYLQQLDAIGAIIAVPDGKGRLLVIRNLQERPARPVYEDVFGLNQIYWQDNRPDSTESVAVELSLPFVPSAIIALLPQKFEDELVVKEKAYRNRDEADILRTRFSITFRNGQHVIRVIEQDPMPGKK